MRPIPNISHLLKAIGSIILAKLIPAIKDVIKINQIKIKLLSLPAKCGVLAILILPEISDDKYKNSLNVTKHLSNNIIKQ